MGSPAVNREGNIVGKLADRAVRTRVVSRVALLPVVAFVVVTSLVACQPARTEDRSRPIIFVHGYNFSPASVDCGGTFDTMIAQLRGDGFTGPMIKVGYYAADTHCDINLHNFGSFDDRDSWKTIAKSFSNYVQTTFTSKGTTVDAVGYSMGALVVRGGIYGSSIGESGFAAPIEIEDYVSLGGPHSGAAWYTNGCLWGQCAAMKPGSTDLNWLNQNTNPKGKNGTDSTVIGSTADDTVPWQSATYMSVPAANKMVYDTIEHSGSDNYTHDHGVILRADFALALPGQ